MNRSAGGLAISVPESFPLGILLSVRIVAAPERTPWTQVEVKECQRLAGRWLLHCQFVQVPPPEVLVLFR
jgi:hypothetical protein